MMKNTHGLDFSVLVKDTAMVDDLADQHISGYIAVVPFALTHFTNRAFARYTCQLDS